MTELSSTPAERSRNAFSRVLQAMQEPGTQRNAAQALGTSETTVSRIKTDKLEDAISLLYHVGFKVVPQEMRCFPQDYVQALHALARMHVEEGPKLLWE